MNEWLDSFQFDPIKPLLDSGNTQVIYFTNRDLLDKKVGSIEPLWKLKIPTQILKKQLSDGSWRYPGKRSWHTTDYDQLETYHQLGFLVKMFGFDKRHSAIKKTAEYFFSKQSREGDFRGIYAKQYSPNYTAAIAELLAIAGYGNDERVINVFDWLLSIRQQDGGWALPLRTKGHNLEVILTSDTIEPDKTKPFSHFVTGIVLRAFAVHYEYAKVQEAKKAGELLATSFFKKDVYTDLNQATAWETFSYPFWNTDLISSLDVLARLGFDKEERAISEAVDWLMSRQKPDGIFDLHKNHDRYHDQDLWLGLSICRSIKSLHERAFK